VIKETVSQCVSKYLVKEKLIYDWFNANFDVNITLLPQEKWFL